MMIRTATIEDARGIAEVHIATWLTAYRGLIEDEYLEQLSVQRSEKMWQKNINQNNSTILVVECEEAGIIGFASFGENRELSDYPEYPVEVYAIYILKQFSRQGIGTRLFTDINKRLAHLGIASYLLWMLEGNSTEAFYRKLGGKLIETKPYKIGEQDVNICGFAFNID